MPDGKAKQYLAEYLELWHVTDAAYSKLLKRWNLSLNALWVINLLHRHPEGVEPAVIAELTHTLRQTVTVVLNDLEERGCLYREPNLTDRRRKRIRLTPAGRKFCGEVLETVGRIELDCIAEMNEEEQQQLIRLSRRFCANLVRAVEAE